MSNQTTKTNPYTITDAEIDEAVQIVDAKLSANTEAVDELILAALDDYTKTRREMGIKGKLAPLNQFRAIARYCYLFGYALSMHDTKAALEMTAEEEAARRSLV